MLDRQRRIKAALEEANENYRQEQQLVNTISNKPPAATVKPNFCKADNNG